MYLVGVYNLFETAAELSIRSIMLDTINLTHIYEVLSMSGTSSLSILNFRVGGGKYVGR